MPIRLYTVYMRISFFISFVLVLIIPFTVSAQSIQPQGTRLGSVSPFTISVSPQYPKPFGQMTLSFLSDTLNMANANLKIYVNSKQIYKGSVKPIQVSIGSTGKPILILATIHSNGLLYKKSILVQPEDVSIILEPQSLVPPLYKGGAITPLEGNVRIVAMANLRKTNGTKLNPKTLSYSWTVDGVRIENSSGIGRDAILVASPLQYRNRSVSVTVQSQDGTLIGGDSSVFYANKPIVRIYKKDPLLGIRFNQAISRTFTVGNTESSLYAVPFYMPLITTPVIEWFLNGSKAQKGNTITLRPTKTSKGFASLSLTSSTATYVSTSVNLELNFGYKQKNNFFGL